MRGEGVRPGKVVPAEGGGEEYQPSRSELRLIARSPGRFAMTPEERRRAVEACLAALRSGSCRTRIAAAKAMAELDRINLEQEKRDQALPDSFNLHVQGHGPLDAVLEQYRRYFEGGAARDDGAEKPVDPPPPDSAPG